MDGAVITFSRRVKFRVVAGAGGVLGMRGEEMMTADKREYLL